MREVVITHAKRTAIGRFCGALKGTSAVQFTSELAKNVLDLSDLKKDIDQVILGMARQAGAGPNPARQVQYFSGIPEDRTAYTLNMACGSGLLSILQAAGAIEREEAEIVLAGGMESMTQVPFILPEYRLGHRLGHKKLVDNMYQDGFHCQIADQLMGATAETLADELGISRSEQDEFAVRSQQRCGEAESQGYWKDEISPISIQSKKGDMIFEKDEHPRPDAKRESMARLPAVFRDDGTVSAGNSSGITDGAALLILMSRAEAEKRNLPILASVGQWAQAGVDPKRMGLGPVPATEKLMKKLACGIDHFDLVELNEAFAAQVLACNKQLNISAERLNVNGGSIALGHPIGCTGARIVVTLLNEMKRREVRQGLATLCISGGLGLAAQFVRN